MTAVQTPKVVLSEMASDDWDDMDFPSELKSYGRKTMHEWLVVDDAVEQRQQIKVEPSNADFVVVSVQPFQGEECAEVFVPRARPAKCPTNAMMEKVLFTRRQRDASTGRRTTAFLVKWKGLDRGTWLTAEELKAFINS
jgi:hypothetical protein